MNVILASLKKELREVMRDKRTLLLTVLVPMVFYPALVLLTGGLTAKQQSKEQSREIVVGVGFDSADERAKAGFESVQSHSEGVVWEQVQLGEIADSMSNEKYDVCVELEGMNASVSEPNPWLNVKLHYFSTAGGESDLLRVSDSFKGLKQDLIQQKIGNVLEVDLHKDYATARASTGSKFGGVAAYFIVFLAFTGCMAVAVDVAAGEKERGTLEAMLVTPASFWEVVFGKILFVVVMGLLSVFSTGVGLGAMGLIAANALGAVGLGGMSFVSLLGVGLLVLMTVLFFAVLLFAVSIMAKSNREAHLRSSLLMLFIAMALIYCTLPGVESKGGVLLIPVLNVAIAIRALWEGTLSMVGYLSVVGTLALLVIITLWYVHSRVNNDREKVLLK